MLNNMKRANTLLIALLLIFAGTIAQTTFKEQKVGHIFYVSLPDYMTKTTGQNDDAVIQFKNTIKDIAGFIIEDNKEEMLLADLKFSSVDEYYQNFIKDFLLKEKKRTISEPSTKTIGDIKFITCDASYYDKDVKSEIYYFIGLAETKDSFYKLLCYGGMECKEKYKADFEKILYSIKD